MGGRSNLSCWLPHWPAAPPIGNAHSRPVSRCARTQPIVVLIPTPEPCSRRGSYFWLTGVPVRGAHPEIAGPHPFASRLVATEVEPRGGPPVPCGVDSVAVHGISRTFRGVVYRRSLQFPLLPTVVPVRDAYPGIAGSRTCLRVVAGVKPRAKPRGEASAAACAFWRASTQRSILVLAGSIPQRYLRPRAATEVHPHRPSSHPPAVVLWWPPSRRYFWPTPSSFERVVV